jgi:hypothetical protein
MSFYKAKLETTADSNIYTHKKIHIILKYLFIYTFKFCRLWPWIFT